MPTNGRGRQERPKLSPAALAASAIGIADTESLGAVTVRRLAQHHGVAPTALYWHFRDKDQLLDSMAEHLFAEVRLPQQNSDSWDAQLRGVLEAVVTALRPHPAVAPLLPDRVLSSESGLLITERTLSLLRESGLPDAHVAESGGYLLSALVALVTAEPGRRLPKDEDERDDAVRVRRASLLALSQRRFPTVVALADPLSDCAKPDDYYAFGIDMLIRGVTASSQALQPEGV